MSVAHEIHAALKRNGVGRVFCVPGESYLALLDQFNDPDGPPLVSTRHEEGAGLMAEAHAKLTGELGVVMVTRGPGLTHLAIALHTALQDSTPLLAIVGQVPSGVRYRESFQEMDIEAFGLATAKWALEIRSADRAGELIEQAIRVARSGRPGPVVVSIPEDVDRATAAPAPRYGQGIIRNVSAPVPNDGLVDGLSAGSRVAIVAGRPVSGRPGVRRAVERLADLLEAPVYNAWRRFDAFDNDHPRFAGNIPILSAAGRADLSSADVVLLVDDRLDEFTSLNYAIPTAEQTVLVVGDAASGLESEGDYASFLDALADRLGGVSKDPRYAVDAVERYRQYTAAGSPQQIAAMAADHPAVLARAFADAVPADTVLTSDAGTFASWIYRSCSFTGEMRFLAPTAGGMGYAVPSAIAASLARPDVPVVAVVGDGGFAMTMSELDTASREGVGGIGVFVFDNETYGTIAAHQDRNFPGRRVGTALGPVDYSGLATALGWEACIVRSADDMRAAVARVADGRSRLLVHVPVPKDVLNPLGFAWPETEGSAR